MRLTIGIAFGMSIVIAYWILSNAVQRLAGQEVLTLPIEKHTDSLRDGMWKAIVASPTNDLWVVMMQATDRGEGYRTEFGVQIFSRMETNKWTVIYDESYKATDIPQKPESFMIPTSNVIARLVWKGRVSECVLERNP